MFAIAVLYIIIIGIIVAMGNNITFKNLETIKEDHCGNEKKY